MAVKTWIATSGGNYTTAANWSPTGAPVGSDDVRITGDTTGGAVTLAAAASALATLHIDRANTFTINSGGSVFGGTVQVGQSVGGSRINVNSGGSLGGTTLTIGAAASATGSVVAVDGGTLSFSSSITVGSAAAGELSLKNYSGSFSAGITVGSDNAAGTLKLGDGGTFTSSGIPSLSLNNANSLVVFDQTNPHTYSGNISGLGSVTVTGAALTLSNSTLSYTGTTTIDSGSSLTVTGSSASLASSTIVNNGALTISTSGGATYNNAISGSGAITWGVSSGAIYIMASVAKTYTGATTVSNGELELQIASGLGTTEAGTTIASGAQLRLNSMTPMAIGAEALTLAGNGPSGGGGGALRSAGANHSFAGAITLSAAAAIIADPGAGLALTGGITANNFSLTLGGNGTVSQSGVIALGTGGLIKNGAGTLTLSGANTYSGGTQLNGGTLVVTNASALGTGAVAGGAFATLRGDGVTIANAISSSGVFLDTPTTFGVNGVISGSFGGLIKSGAGMLLLGGANTFSGGINLQAGTIGLTDSATALGSGTFFMANGTTLSKATPGALAIGNNIQLATGAETFTGVAGSALTLNGMISGPGTPVITGPDIRFNGNNNFGLGVEIGANAQLTLGNANALGTAPSVTFTSSGGALVTDVNASVSMVFLNTGVSARLAAKAGDTLTLNGAFNFAAGAGATLTIGSAADTGVVVLANTGSTLVDAANATLAIAGGTLRLGSVFGRALFEAMGDVVIGTGATIARLDIGEWEVEPINNLSGNANGRIGTSVNETLLVTFANNRDTTFHGVIEDVAGPNFININKNGANKLTLTGVHLYEGATGVGAGTLALAGAGSIASSSAVFIDNGATFDISGTTSGATVKHLEGAGGTVNFGGKTLTVSAAYADIGALTLNGAAGSDVLNVTLRSDIATYSGAALTFTNWTTGQDVVFIVGNAGANTITGSSQGDNLTGGGGADQLNGGGGFDYARYDNSLARVVARLDGGDQTDDAFGDTFSSIEGLVGTNLGDFLAGDGNDNIIYGLDGDDFISTEGGDDILQGDGGIDHLFGGAGADTYNGGSGVDFAHYDFSPTGVTAGLGGQTGSGHAAGDVFNEVEGLVGSQFLDTLFGNGQDNLIYGLIGNDTIFGGAGADYLDGGDSADVVMGEAGNDTLFGGNGDDPWLSGGGDADVINGDAGNDMVRGDDGNDIWLDGGADNDTIYGGQGSDNLIGGSGADEFQYFSPTEGGDTIFGFVSGLDKIRIAVSGFGTLTGFIAAANPLSINSGPNLLYNTGNGQLTFDSNGTGVGGQTLLATLSGAPLLQYGDLILA